MSRIPWITAVLGTLIALVPPGRGMIEGAFFSSEALTRNIARPLVMIGIGILAAVAVIEWFVRSFFHRRRQPASTKTTE